MARNWSIPPRSLKVHDLIYVNKGEGVLDLGEASHALKAGRWVLIPASFMHSMRHDRDNPLHLSVIHFEATLGPGIDAIPVLFRPPALKTPDKEAMECLRQILSTYRQGDAINLMLADKWAGILICLLAREQSHPPLLDSRVSALLLYIHANYARDLTLEHLGRVIHVSASHMRDLFKHSIGLAPMAYLQKLRLEKAQSLLRTTELSIGEIAFQTGWKDHTAFDRIFRKRISLTPAEYRTATQRLV